MANKETNKFKASSMTLNSIKSYQQLGIQYCKGLMIRHRPVHMWSLRVARQVVMYADCLLLYKLNPFECHYN